MAENKTTKRTQADKIRIAQDICEAYALGNVTIESCCGEFGITFRTLFNWAEEISEISDIYKKAKETHSRANKDGIREKALTSLEKMILGFHVEEEETEEMTNAKGKVVMKKVKKKKKFISPNVTAIIFALKNADPLHWNEDLTIDFGGEEQVFKIGDQEIKFK
jgi:hypothetical protein